MPKQLKFSFLTRKNGFLQRIYREHIVPNKLYEYVKKLEGKIYYLENIKPHLMCENKECSDKIGNNNPEIPSGCNEMGTLIFLKIAKHIYGKLIFKEFNLECIGIGSHIEWLIVCCFLIKWNEFFITLLRGTYIRKRRWFSRQVRKTIRRIR